MLVKRGENNNSYYVDGELQFEVIPLLLKRVYDKEK